MSEAELLVESQPEVFQHKLRRYVGLEKHRRDLEEQLEDVQGRIKLLADDLLEEFLSNGVKNIRCDDLTVYVRNDQFVSKRKEVATQTICDLLESLGRGDMVNDGYNAASLKSFVLEQLATKRELEIEINQLNGADVEARAELEAQLAAADVIRPLVELLNVGSVPRIVTTK